MNFQKPASVTVLQPDIEAIVMPRTEMDYQMAVQISGHEMLKPAIAEYFTLKAREVNYTQLKQPNGKPHYDIRMDNDVKRFYVFALQQPGAASYHDDPDYMIALQCSVHEPRKNSYAVLPEKLFRGQHAAFVMSATFACCSSAGGRARTMLYSDRSPSKGHFLNRAFAGDGLRAEIKGVWNRMETTVVDGMGAMVLQHLARDITGGGCNHPGLINPAKAGHWKGKTLSL